MSAVDKDFTTLMSETKPVNETPCFIPSAFWMAWPHIRRWKMQNHEAEKELYAQREATMLELREWIQLKLLVKVFDSWACAAGVGPPPLMTSEDEGAPNVPDIADMQADSDADSDDDRHQSEADQALEKMTWDSFCKELLETFPANGLPAASMLGHKVCFVPATNQHYKLPQNDGNKPYHGMCKWCHVLKASIRYCAPCDRWLREAHWEEAHWAAHNNLKKNKDNKKKHKRVHHKAGKKHQKKRSIQKKAGLPAIPEWD